MESGKRGVKRKKKSFLKKARKYGRKGQFGRGTHINEDTYQYFIRVLELNKDGFTSEEEKRVFVDNVFEQTDGEEINYSCNQLASRAIENLLEFASDTVINRFITVFDENIRPICADRFASHVLQKLIIVASDRETVEPNGNRLWIEKVSLFLLNNIEELAWDTYANHVARTALQQLGELLEKQPRLEGTLKQFSRQLAKLQQLKDMVSEALPSAFLQSSLAALGPMSGPLLRRLLQDVFSNEAGDGGVPQVACQEATARLAEAAVIAAGAHHPDILDELWQRLGHKHAADLALHRTGNFLLQRLLQYCPSTIQLEQTLDELSGSLNNVLTAGYSGVLLSLAQACKRLGAHQSRFTKELLESLECWEPEEHRLKAAICVATLTRYSGLQQESKPTVRLHGSLLLQELLNFKKPIMMVRSLLSIPSSELSVLLSNPCGCHIMDAFATSPTVGEKSREKMVRALQSQFVSLACSQHGSRVLDALWEQMPPKQRERIASELCASRDHVRGDRWGRGVWARYGLDTFVHRRADWVAAQQGKDRVRRLFADIVAPTKE